MEMQIFVENGEYMEVIEAVTCGMCKGTGKNVLATFPVENGEYMEIHREIEACAHCDGTGLRILN